MKRGVMQCKPMEKLRNAKIRWQKSHREIKESTNHGKMKYGT
jgi:hypothetical protein